MPPVPITAPNLLVARYTVAGESHKAQMYCEAIVSGDPTGYDLIGRLSLGNVGLSTVADPFFTAIANLFTAADCSFQGVELWERVGGSYVFQAAQVTTVTPALGGYYQPASGFDVCGKAEDNSNFHFYIYEGPFGVSTKIRSYAAASANVKTLIDYLFNVGSAPAATDAWNWRLSRGHWRPSRWLSGVIDSNEKLRRMRGIK
jgi:hypothetical protein